MKRLAKAPSSIPRPIPAPRDLAEEINMLRGLIRQVIELADEERSFGELLSILEVVGKSSYRLATLLKVNRELGNGEGLMEVLNQAVSETMQELGIKRPG